jgi:hypothetical protein
MRHAAPACAGVQPRAHARASSGVRDVLRFIVCEAFLEPPLEILTLRGIRHE